MADPQLSFDSWYALRDLPDGQGKVRVYWNRKEFVAARVRDSQQQLIWAHLVDGVMEVLPPRRYASRWSPEPERWQPENPAIWVWASGVAPQPLQLSGPSLARIVRRRDDNGALGQGRCVWWLDRSQVTFSTPLTERQVEGRLMRAMAADAPDRWRADNGLQRSNVLARMARAAAVALDEYEFDGDQRPLPNFVGDGRDEDDFVTAVSWLKGLDHDHCAVLHHASRVPALSWGRIAQACDLRHDKAAASVYRAAIARAFEVAVSASTATTRTVARVR